MKKAYLLLPLLLSPAFSSIFDDLRTTEEKSQSIFVASLGEGMLRADYDIVKAARLLPVETQVSGIRELIRMAKSYSRTEAFAREYKKWRDERLGYREKPRGLRVPSLGKVINNAVDKKLNKAEDEKKYPSDPREMIRKRLQEFLDLSATVDFDATTVSGRFENPAYEAKSNQWKMCYRAGKPVVEAARAEAQAWLGELQ